MTSDLLDSSQILLNQSFEWMLRNCFVDQLIDSLLWASQQRPHKCSKVVVPARRHLLYLIKVIRSIDQITSFTSISYSLTLSSMSLLIDRFSVFVVDDTLTELQKVKKYVQSQLPLQRSLWLSFCGAIYLMALTYPYSWMDGCYAMIL
jgi:hypothetical protein